MKALSRTLACVLALSLALGFARAQDAAGAPGYRIDVQVDGFAGDTMFLANYFMDKQYIVDTAVARGGGATFSGPEVLPEGSYLLVLPPDNDYAQVMVDADQHFTLHTTAGELATAMRVAGSEENELFYGYLTALATLRPTADSLRALQADSTLPQNQRDAAAAAGKRIDERVVAKQTEIRERHPTTITAALLRTMVEPEFPTVTGTDPEQQQARYLWYKAHYFDGVDLGDPRNLRTSWFDERITYYLDKLVVPVPDSINRELDMLLEGMRPAPETFRFYTSKFLNDYAASKIVGMDAVYVHLGERYYVSGEADWSDSATIAKIGENVAKLKPLLIGQPAPALVLEREDGSAYDLYASTAAYTVLFFFDPECGHCEKQTPDVIAFAKAYKARGVDVVSVCSKFAPNVGGCWTYVGEKEGMGEYLINTADPYHKSKFKVTYDISSTPQIYVIDKDKKIISKRIAAEQLPEVMDRFLGMELDDNGPITEQ